MLWTLASFDLIPAIDLRGGRVVRLVEGDFARETGFSSDPMAVAAGFIDRGARWLHVVDLDGAREGRRAQADVVARIVGAVGARAAVEVAGGLRSAASVDAVLNVGAARVVLGTAALAAPNLVADLLDRHGPARIAVALDVRDGYAVGSAWVRGAGGVPFVDALRNSIGIGVRWFEVTAISRDGRLEGPDLPLLASVVAAAPGASVIASAGIRSIADLRAVRALGCAGAIVGRALYEGALDLAAAITALEG